jgi:UDP-3-O-[3-hydroxymyristoyl] glucosamine N-acyltransferase
MAYTDTHTFVFKGSDGSSVSAHIHSNPDGSVGGWVADDAIIDPTAVVEVDAVVGPRATIGPRVRIRSHRIIPMGAVIR